MGKTQWARLFTLMSSGLLIAGIFLLDASTPKGAAFSTLYLFPLFLLRHFAGPLYFYGIPSLLSILIFLGMHMGPPGAPLPMIHVHRIISCCAVWLIAFAYEGQRRSLLKSEQYSKSLILTIKDLQRLERIFQSVLEDAKTAQTALKKTEKYFRDIVLAAPNAMILVNREGTITLINARAEALFGYTREELLGQKIEMLIPERHRPQHRGYRDSFFKAPATRPMGAGRDLFGLHKDGSEIPIEIGLGSIETAEGTFTLASIIDITDRKESERKKQELIAARAYAEAEKRRAKEIEEREMQLRQTQAMLVQAEKMAGIGQMAAGVAHEIKNPLGIISQGVSYLKSLAKEGKKLPLDLVVKIEKAINRADGIIRALLDYSRPSSLSLEPCDIRQVVDAAVGFLQEQLSESDNINIIRQYKATTHELLLDKARMEQVFLNLFLNAKDAMPHGGDIIIRTHTHQESQINAFVCEIQDTGSGISQEDLSKVFAPFFTTKKPGKGTGLGLSIVHSILENHGARITMRSAVGKGTTAVLTFSLMPTKEFSNG